MPRSSLVAVATFSSVGVSTAISIIWFITAQGASRFEPAVATLGLLAGLTGVLAERRVAAQERRHITLMTLMDELHRDTSILDDPRLAPSQKTPRPRVYPRLPVSATDAALISGAPTERGDTELLHRLHNWRDEVNGFNQRLELTEIRIFTAGVPAEIAEFERALHHSNGYLNPLRRHLQDLQNYLVANHKITSRRQEMPNTDGSSVPPPHTPAPQYLGCAAAESRSPRPAAP
jgi:hypothetical protein